MAQKIKKISKKCIALICMFTLVFSYSVVGVNDSDASALTVLKDTLSDSRASETYVQHTITFKATTAVPISGKIVLDFPAGFNTIGVNAADITFKSDSVATPTTAYTLVDTITDATTQTLVENTDADGGTITFTLCSTGTGTCDIAIADYVLITIGDGISGTLIDIPNPATGVYQIDIDTQTAAAVAIDSGSIAVAIVASGVSVSATIDAYLTFEINDTAVGLGSWSAGSVAKRWADNTAGGLDGDTADPGDGNAIRLTTNSNGEGGASITARSVNGLLSGTSDTIGAAAVCPVDVAGCLVNAGGTEGYGIYATFISATAGPFTIENTFDADADGQAAIDTTNQVIAISTAVPLDASIIDIDVVAAINATTLAGSYSDTLVLIGTATY